METYCLAVTRHNKTSELRNARRSKGKMKTTVTAAAIQLGVSREHLSRVLHGHRESRSLQSRYRNLISTL